MLTINAVTQIIPSEAGKPISPISGSNTLVIKSTAPTISRNLIMKTNGIRILYRGTVTSLIS